MGSTSVAETFLNVVQTRLHDGQCLLVREKLFELLASVDGVLRSMDDRLRMSGWHQQERNPYRYHRDRRFIEIVSKPDRTNVAIDSDVLPDVNAYVPGR